MTDAILVALGDLPQPVIGVIRGNGDPAGFGDQEGATYIVPSDPPVCAGQIWDGQAATNPPAPDPGPPPVPYRISRMQGRRALKAAGLLATAEGYFAGLDADDDARMTYEDASHWERDHPMIAGLAALLSLDSGEVDDLFIDASQIA